MDRNGRGVSINDLIRPLVECFFTVQLFVQTYSLIFGMVVVGAVAIGVGFYYTYLGPDDRTTLKSTRELRGQIEKN
jgi:hypothetical protein